MFPHRLPHRNLICALVALFLLFTACSNRESEQHQQAGGTVTEQQVTALLNEIDKDARDLKFDALTEHLSKDAHIEMHVQGYGYLTFTRDEYRDYTRQAYNSVSAYHYDRKNTVIKVAPDGQSAMGSDQVYETVTMGGQTTHSTTLETATFKMEDGRVVIASLVGDVFPN
jgi:hypothetical protein